MSYKNDYYPIMCTACKHYKGKTLTEQGTYRENCTAFPNGIPDPIRMGETYHIETYETQSPFAPTDNGITFELKGSNQEMTLEEKKELSRYFPLPQPYKSDEIDDGIVVD